MDKGVGIINQISTAVFRMNNLVIVESPAKAKTIEKYLGPGYRVEASFGHISDLPVDDLGLDLSTLNANYVLTDGGKKTVSKLKPLAESANVVFLATDLDREGEAIAWHLKNVLKLKNYKRITFNEITKSAVNNAIKKPQRLDMGKVDAQQARRFLDRIIGYLVSPALSNATGHNLSAGRVQSPAVLLIYLREKEIENFVSTDHFGVDLEFEHPKGSWKARWDTKPFVTDENPYITDESIARQVMNVGQVSVVRCSDSEKKKSPLPPLITSTMQQVASTKLKLSTDKTMKLAQKLYEAGLITYMRTDFPNLSDEAIASVREFLNSTKWAEDLADKPNKWNAKAGAQEAHEAIRPTDFSLESPPGLSKDELALYSLIRKRAIASQMKPSVYSVRSIELESCESIAVLNSKVKFTASSRTCIYAGWEGFLKDLLDSDVETEDSQSFLPALQSGTTISSDNSELLSFTTKPPNRYTEASLLKKMEKEGIGRPSTYASIFKNIQLKKYVELRKQKYFLLPRGDLLIQALLERFSFVDLDYTRNLESDLDLVANGNVEFTKVVRTALNNVEKDIQKLSNVDIKNEQLSCKECGRPLVFITSAQFWSCTGFKSGECKASYPDDKGKPYFHPENPEHFCKHCDSPLLRAKSKVGWYWRCSSGSTEKCKEIFDDYRGKPKAKVKHECPQCSSTLIRRPSKKEKGKYWWGCSGYKNGCKFIANDSKGKPVINAAKTESFTEDLGACEKCDSGRKVRRPIKRGKHAGKSMIGCSNFPDCDFAIWPKS